MSTTPADLRLALSMTAPNGICSSSGNLHASSRIPSMLMYGRDVTFTIGKTNARAVIPDVLELMTDGRLRPERVTSVVANFDDACEALTQHVRLGHAKTVVTRS